LATNYFTLHTNSHTAHVYKSSCKKLELSFNGSSPYYNNKSTVSLLTKLEFTIHMYTLK